MLDQNRILKINIENEMKSAYIDYSMSVIVSRALPDVRDGLKPVQRRVLFGMNAMGNTSDKAHRKSANCVGEVMGRYHPHGDSSIYGTVVRMAQDWSLRYTLIDGHGNFGSVDGDGAAAMRYTEVRLSKMGEEMLTDIEKETVDMQRNYDNTRDEPTVLPTRFPNLLVNGAQGIAVGMATNMPPHNLTESINASIAVLENPEITIPELMKIITAPDFPTGGTIYGYQGVKDAYETGRGRVVIRARAEIEKDGSHENIVVTEIPYGVNKAELIKYIAGLVNEKKLDGIADINDYTSHQGMRIVIKVRQDANASVVLNKLYKMTQMQAAFSVNNVALVNGRPQTLNLKQLLEEFVKHRHDVVTRRTKFELRKAEKRAHILQAQIVASQFIDEVIAIIRGADSVDDAKQKLCERFGFDDEQAQAIVDMQLKKLAKLEQNKLQEEFDDLQKLIAHLQLILSDENVMRELIKSELIEERDKYGDDRKTDIDYTAGDFNAEDFYSDDDMVITISHMGYIKRTPLTEFRTQNRGGVGVRGSDTRDEDFIEHVYMASMHNTLLFFTKKGLVYRLKVYELPEGARNSKGRALQNLLNIEPGDKVQAYIGYKPMADDAEFVNSHYLMFATRKGLVKKTKLSEYVRIMAKGKKAILIREGDDLIAVGLTDGESEVLLANRNGRAVRFSESKVRSMGRVSAGVRGMKLDDDGHDEVVGMIIYEPGSENTVMSISEKGFGKRSEVGGYRMTNRGSKGVRTMKVTEKTGHQVAFESVNDDNDLIIINESGITIRIRVADVRVMGRNTQGVRIINLEKRNDSIASVCCVNSDPEEEVEAVEAGEELPGIEDVDAEEIETEEPDTDEGDEPEEITPEEE
ncbi:MAG: DNA gyrase subunit A [Bacteroidales bacterium]|nr:DNA gyrase subunit A [Bacteroidales bacterium]